MIVTIKRDLRYYPDTYIVAGTDAVVLSKAAAAKLPRLEQGALLRAKWLYEKREIKGVFAFLLGKFRWVDEGDYE